MATGTAKRLCSVCYWLLLLLLLLSQGNQVVLSLELADGACETYQLFFSTLNASGPRGKHITEEVTFKHTQQLKNGGVGSSHVIVLRTKHHSAGREHVSIGACTG